MVSSASKFPRRQVSGLLLELNPEMKAKVMAVNKLPRDVGDNASTLLRDQVLRDLQLGIIAD